jgi:allantoicase/malate synthase/CubicO group peptidase (beta-lactamase class C family)/2-oxo-4-hydroxy-4-carboxy--5-ureidoimidazoline (OHCU) decarboxylase
LKSSEIAYYDDFLSPALKEHILKSTKAVPGVPGMMMVGSPSGLETTESLAYLRDLYLSLKDELKSVLNHRIADRKFIDERTLALKAYNEEFKKDYLSPEYKTIFGMEDSAGRIVMGPLKHDFHKPGGKKIAPIPEFLQGPHVTLFGPPDSTKLSINAMNAYHRKIKDEPAIIAELLSTHDSLPKWGADDEDSKTPLHEDLVSAGVNLTGCMDGNIALSENGKNYELAKDKLSLPIKRFPGLALPSFFLFFEGEAVPLHLYDFAMHFFRNWHNPKALAFYVPKLENEEEARYIRIMMESAEKLLKKIHPEYKMGSIRLMIVLENPRAVFRTHEIMDELYPYFVGASLGWHDYLASTARLFKEDSNYRIPVKADPDIVIKYIKASHDLLADVVGERGGIKVGGMYGILPTTAELKTPSYQITIKGYIKDVITQMKRNLSGFWVAHPDFVRQGLALLEAWKFHQQGDPSKLEKLVKALLDEEHHQEIMNFINGPDIEGLDKDDPMFPRSLIVADMKESDYIANNHPDEIRYNVFQSLQYITDWLSGNGCVALPSIVKNTPVRVMDDLATAERSRWEVWHELYHGRFSLEEFLKIAHEEYLFIRKDKSNEKKIVQVKWDERTEKWYPVALNLMIKLMTDKNPVEFATQLLLPFTIEGVRNAEDPWKKILELDSDKFQIEDHIKRFSYFFEMCGSLTFARKMASQVAVDLEVAKKTVMSFEKNDILESASFHGDIGESKKTLDKMASAEQGKVLSGDEKTREDLRNLGEKYLQKFGMKFLVSAAGKSGEELRSLLEARMGNPESVELDNARSALWEITAKRMKLHPLNGLKEKLDAAFQKYGIHDAQITILTGRGEHQNLAFGKASKSTLFEIASLSKSVASCFAIEFLTKKGISLEESVSKYVPEMDFPSELRICHLMSHQGLNLHYVNGVPLNEKMPKISEFLKGNEKYGYEKIKVINTPGEKFQYSGAGFIVLEHLLEKISGKDIRELTKDFLSTLEMDEFTFAQENLPGFDYANGYKDNGELIEGTRKMFPAFAAGALSSSHSVAHFLLSLDKANHDLQGFRGISHDTARLMLHGSDKGCREFMNSLMGLGIFIVEAGENRFMLHQGANDGFRCIFLHCYSGPDRGKGLVSLCNADFKGVLFNAEVTQEILKELKIVGIDYSKFKTDFKSDSLPQEQVVNLGYKQLVLDAFQRTRPEAITDKGPLDPLAPYNLCVGGEVLSVTNDLFARAENLLSDHLPLFNPLLFGKQGKIMDSWETVRHNVSGKDTLHVKLKSPGTVHYLLLSTKYHTGNFSPEVSIEGKVGESWKEILGRQPLRGHSELRLKLAAGIGPVSEIKVHQYPDGGFTRLGLYEKLPESEKASFDGVSKEYPEKVPAPARPLNIPYEPNQKEITANWKSISGEFNNASLALGARVLSASDEHYSPASQALSPFAPINMFDGLESARSRRPDHCEELVIKLAKAAPIKRVEFDYTYFVNNNPLDVRVFAKSADKWEEIIPRTRVKAFAGSQKIFTLNSSKTYTELKIENHPCGGMNRVRVISV